MENLTTRTQVLIAFGLVVLMAATRVPYLPGMESMFGASWAVFFLAGFYLRSVLAVPAFLALAVLLDGIALGWADAASYCLTPAYALLAPAYASLWVAGRWAASRYRFAASMLVPLTGSLLIGGAVCELLSSGGFYWLSGVFADPTVAKFAVRETIYFPPYLASLCLWVGLAAAVHIGVITARGQGDLRSAS